jgi:hypothetical protein
VSGKLRTNGFQWKVNFDIVVFQVRQSLFQIVSLPVFSQVLEVRLDNVFPLWNNVFQNLEFIVGFRLTLFHGYGILGTGRNARPESVTEQIPDKTGFAVDYLQCSFGTIGNTQSAAVAFFLVDPYDFSFHIGLTFRLILITLKIMACSDDEVLDSDQGNDNFPLESRFCAKSLISICMYVDAV